MQVVDEHGSCDDLNPCRGKSIHSIETSWAQVHNDFIVRDIHESIFLQVLLTLLGKNVWDPFFPVTICSAYTVADLIIDKPAVYDIMSAGEYDNFHHTQIHDLPYICHLDHGPVLLFRPLHSIY